MRISEVIFDIISRIFLTCLVFAAAIVPTLLLGYFGGDNVGKALIWILGAIFVTGMGWSLFPLFRYSPRCSYVSIAIWIAFGGYLWIFFGEGSARGWVAGPWLLASLILGCILNAKPQLYTGSSSAINEKSPDKPSA